MVYYKLGDVIVELRGRAKMTQDELSEDICSVSSLSRIERGEQMPSGEKTEILFEKLGMGANFFVGFGSVKELEYLQSWEYLSYWAHNQDGSEDDTAKQLLEYVLAVELQKQEQKGQVLGRLLGALSFSLSIEEIYRESNRQVYTYLELHILSSLAVEYYRLDNLETALKILEKLYRYMKTQYMDKTIKRHLSPVILNNLSCLKYKDEKYVEALAYCKEGIALCIQMGNIKILPYLYGNMSCIYEKYGREQDVEKAYNRMQLMIDIMDDNLSRPLLYDKLSEPFIIVNAW